MIIMHQVIFWCKYNCIHVFQGFKVICKKLDNLEEKMDRVLQQQQQATFSREQVDEVSVLSFSQFHIKSNR